MKTLALLCLLLSSTCRADDYDIIHFFAHLGAGEVIAVPTACFLKATGFTKKYPVISGVIVVGLPTLVGYLKEKDDFENGGKFNYTQWGATSLSGVLVETVVVTYSF